MIEKIRAEIKEVEKQATAANDRLLLLRHTLAAMSCPYRIGQKTTAKGYSRAGKECIIIQIRPGSHWHGEWTVVAAIVNKDGKQSKITVSWHEHQEPNYKRRK